MNRIEMGTERVLRDQYGFEGLGGQGKGRVCVGYKRGIVSDTRSARKKAYCCENTDIPRSTKQLVSAMEAMS